jgi:hypothetical protein
MWISKQKKKNLIDDEIRELGKRISILENSIAPYVECETCGCLLKKDTAIEGKKTIEQKLSYDKIFSMQRIDYIHTPYYCRKCKPCITTGESKPQI